MNTQKEWDNILEDLLVASQVLSEEIAVAAKKDPARGMCHLFHQKGLNTFRAVHVLYKESLPMEAQVLIRVLMEVRMDMEIFLRLAVTDPGKAVKRIIDSMMLEKVKQQRQSKFQGLDLVEGAPTSEQLLDMEKSLVKQYGQDAAKRMRRYGFSGLSVEARAQITGLEDLYNVVYRNFSRNVHATDYSEMLRALGLVKSSQWADYEELRDDVALSTASTCIWQIGWLANDALGCMCGDHLTDAWKRCTEFERWVRLPAPEFVKINPVGE